MGLADLFPTVPVLLDGAWGTQLQERGLPIGECPDAWNLSHPERVAEVAAAYVSAGSFAILTNTFGASRTNLARQGLGERTSDINREGARISKRAAGDSAKVIGSIGPSGAMLPMGETTLEELKLAFREQAKALAEGGADALVVETMSDLDEACCALEAALTTGLPVIASMSYGAGKAGGRTIMGVAPEEAARRLAAEGAHAIGANCGVGAATMRDTVERLRVATGLPVWAKPNAGMPVLVDGKAVYEGTAEEFARDAAALVRAGASLIGGCCGTGPEHIRALRRALEVWA